MNRTTIIVLACLCAACITGCATAPKLDPFTNAGCMFFPTSTFGEETKVSKCCLEHDMAYWQGGTEDERWAADEAFRECLVNTTGSEQLAEMMFNAVRLGGTPHFPSWYGWGYGWSGGREYAPLTNEEKELIQSRLEEFQSTGSTAEAESPPE